MSWARSPGRQSPGVRACRKGGEVRAPPGRWVFVGGAAAARARRCGEG